MDSPGESTLHLHQRDQLAVELGRLLRSGWGRLDLRFENHRPKRISTERQLHQPGGYYPSYRLPSSGSSLDELLGAWRDSFNVAVLEVMGHGAGRVSLCVEHGSLRSISIVFDSPARTGKTGPLAGDLSIKAP